MQVATAPEPTPINSSLAHRIAFPSPAARQSRAELKRHYQMKRARAEMRRMGERMAALARDQRELRDLHEVAQEAAPVRVDESAWPTDISELADKIARQKYGWSPGGLAPSENPVRDKDRQMITKKLPAGIEVQRNDARYH